MREQGAVPPQSCTMFRLAVIAFLISTSVTASQNASTNVTAAQNASCGDIYYPSSLTPSLDKFVLFTAGLTGVGKSTVADMLAGGSEMSKVGPVNGNSETEQACAYHFEYMGGGDPQAGHERWEVLDSPGFDDTGGEYHMMKNDVVMEQALRTMGKVDAVLLVWKYDEKFTESNLDAFLELRSMFDANIWKRVILVYSWWAWEDCVEFLCDCKKQSDLLKVHQDTMTAAFNHINRLAGDVKCNDTVASECFPEAKDIPFVGSDLSLDKLTRMRQLGCDPLVNPSALSGSCTKMCPLDSAGDIRRIRPILQNLTAVPGYQKLDTTGVTNYWAACESTRSTLQIMIDGSAVTFPGHQESLAREAASRLQGCIQGGIASETRKVALLLNGRLDLQTRVAFFMTRREYIAPPFFSSGIAKLVGAYPDYATYKSCKTAADLNYQDAAMLTDVVKECWSSLVSTDGNPRSPAFELSVNTLLSSWKSRSYALRMAIALNMFPCRANGSRCLDYLFARNVSSREELRELDLWSHTAYDGRCCDSRERIMISGAEVCNNSGIIWNQTNINCLRHCSIVDLKISDCTIQRDGEVTCQRRDTFGSFRSVLGFFKAEEVTREGQYIRHGGGITLHFDLKDQVFFVMDKPTEQIATCNEGSWQISAQWVLPKARRVRSCRACLTASECLSTGCISGKGLHNKLWLAGSSEDSDICGDPALCGVQRDSQCNAQPTCTAKGRTAEAGAFKIKDCSNSSCNVEDCCEQLGTCDGVCDCPWKPKKIQPTYCRGSACQKDECCEKDPTVETCSRATGGTCSWGSCYGWRGKTQCVHRGLFQHECECLPGHCARNYGKKTGICVPKCDKPEDCGPDTGGYCDKTMSSLFGINTCKSWRGDTHCVHGRCLCNKKSCAVEYGADTGRCDSHGPTQLGETSSQGYKAEFITTLVAVSAGLLATVSCLLLLVRRRYLHTSSTLNDPLLYGGWLEE